MIIRMSRLGKTLRGARSLDATHTSFVENKQQKGAGIDILVLEQTREESHPRQIMAVFYPGSFSIAFFFMQFDCCL